MSSSAGGLSRRRVPGGGSSTSSNSPTHSSRPSSPDSSSRNGVSGGGGSSNHNGVVSHNHTHIGGGGGLNGTRHAGSAFEGGSKIAYDPRDLEDANEEMKAGGKMPRLTLMEEVLLLGLKDKQGYLSFWNDNISYALRGCILIELALRRRIALVKDPNRKRLPIPERLVEVLDDRQTGETILDETLKMMKAQEGDKMSVNMWIDLLSGETWNVMKIGYQLKQVRERLAKGLVDKGVLRTEKRNFLLFDMATHPVADVRTKESIITRLVTLLTSTTSSIPPNALDKEGVQCRVLRAICLVCTAYTASVMDNAFGRLGYEEREAAFQRCDEILAEFCVYPFGGGSASSSTPGRRRLAGAAGGSGGSGGGGGGVGAGVRIAMGGDGGGRESVLGLLNEVRKESVGSGGSGGGGGEEDLGFELVAGVLEVLSKLDSLI